MCKDCGCSAPAPVHDHEHDHDGHHHTIDLHQSLLAKNDHQAWHNRDAFRRAGTLVLNLLSSPGSGKTKLLERTLTDLAARFRMGVIVGDLQTDNDARRLSNRGAPVVPITTGTLCHLEADLVDRAYRSMNAEPLDILFIENVGNLVCPATFDLGEAIRVVVLSTTEGEDKPLKYPLAFKTAQVVIVNKTDIAEAAGFEREAALENTRNVAPQALVLEVSARTGEGLELWYTFLEQSVRRPSEAQVVGASST